MLYLLVVSLIWGFSFGVIKGTLSGIDTNFVSFSRMFLSLLAFIPFIKLKHIEKSFILKLLVCGAVQYGLMYITYIYSFQFLQAYEVALFTILTPVYITIINDLINKKFNRLYFMAAILAVAGTGIIVYRNMNRSGLIEGFMLVQLSNLVFAFGQIYYKRIMSEHKEIKDLNIFAWLYLGAVLITGIFSAVTVEFSTLTLSTNQVLALLYLSIIASGVCFFLWNIGARSTDAGKLAVFNNLKVPLAVAVSMLFFGESGDLIRLLTGGIIVLLALFIPEIHSKITRRAEA